MKTLALVLSLVLVGCAQQRQQPRQLSAPEIFHLRGECAKLGEALEKENQFMPGVYRVVSNYSPESNRCYLESDYARTSDPDNGAFQDILWDGQTKEGLAKYSVSQGYMGGDFPGCEEHKTCTMEDAKAYIAGKMKRSDQ